MQGIKIWSTGSYLPPVKVSNARMAEIVDTNDEWIVSRSGIKERNFVEEEDTTSMAVIAAKRAIESGEIGKEQIEVVIVATFSPDYMTPSTACMVQKELGLREDILAFDLNAACSGFIYAMNVAHSLLESKNGGYALVIGSDTLSKVTDFSDRSTCVLFGDGAGAAVVSLDETKPFAFVSGAKGGNEVLRCKGIQNTGTPFSEKKREKVPSVIYMNGKEVFRFAVESICKCVQAIISTSGQKLEEIDYFLCHQANYRILSAAAKRLGIQEEKFLMNLDHCGNTSAASIPILLDEMNQKQMFRKGMKMICAGFGGGLTYGGLQLEW